VVLPLVLLASLLAAETALACSCAPVSAKEQFRQSDAAVVARLVDVVPRSEQSSDFVYRVKRAFKGERRLERGDRLTIRSSNSGASCGLPREKRRYGLFLERINGEYTSSLCSVVSPRKMRRAARGSSARASGCRA
jgi:hypothetical protein